jgi:hypothetical protein
MRLPLLATGLATALIVCRAEADTVVDQSNVVGSGGLQVQYHSPVGQSFITQFDNLLGIDLYTSAMNPGSGITDLVVKIRDGSMNGAVLEGGSVSARPTVAGWNSFMFEAPLALTVGNTYVIDVSSATAYWGLGSGGNSYSGGTEFIFGAPTTGDLQFRTLADNGVAAAAPLPGVATAGLALMGGLGLKRGRRKTTA